MNKLIFAVFLGLFLLSNGATAQDTESACGQQTVAVLYFNGVATDGGEAEESLRAIRFLNGETDDNGRPLTYELAYNLTEDGLTDFAEVFIQRAEEQRELLRDRFELFWGIVTGQGGAPSSWQQRIIAAIPSAAEVFESLIDDQQASFFGAIAASHAAPSLALTSAEHRARIDGIALRGSALVMVAHSQGNLFANTAYDRAREQFPSSSLAILHIAPASPRLNGSYVLADLDLVINGLRATGNVPPNNASIPPFFSRSPGYLGRTDPAGHGLFAIYLHRNLESGINVLVNLRSLVNNVTLPPVTTGSGLFTATLTWNGSGDVDLHVIEPNGERVFYANRRGTSGFLDVDNVSGFGPENYFATCDASLIQNGDYNVRLANFSGADGRQSTVQITSFDGSVLGTRQVIMGPRTGNDAVFDMFTVNVSQDEQGRYQVTAD